MRRLLICLAVLLSATACNTAEEPPRDPDSASPQTTSAIAKPTTPSGQEAPQKLVNNYNPCELVTSDDLKQAFSTTSVTQVPPRVTTLPTRRPTVRHWNAAVATPLLPRPTRPHRSP